MLYDDLLIAHLVFKSWLSMILALPLFCNLYNTIKAAQLAVLLGSVVSARSSKAWFTRIISALQFLYITWILGKLFVCSAVPRGWADTAPQEREGQETPCFLYICRGQDLEAETVYIKLLSFSASRIYLLAQWKLSSPCSPASGLWLQFESMLKSFQIRKASLYFLQCRLLGLIVYTHQRYF